MSGLSRGTQAFRPPSFGIAWYGVLMATGTSEMGILLSRDLIVVGGGAGQVSR